MMRDFGEFVVLVSATLLAGILAETVITGLGLALAELSAWL